MLALVVDDDPMVLAIAGRALARVGMRCLGLGSADEAVPALAHLGNEVAVLVTDVQMPGSMDGIGLAAHAGELYPGLPVIVMSGHPEGLLRAGDLAPVVATLAKPFRPDELARLASGAVRPPRSRRTD